MSSLSGLKSALEMAEQQAIEDNFTVCVVQEYAPFLAWLHRHHVVWFSSPGFELKPMPRIRRNNIYPKEQCFRIYVKKKLPENELQDHWDVLYNVFKSGVEFHNFESPSIIIPKTLAGYPTDIVEK